MTKTILSAAPDGNSDLMIGRNLYHGHIVPFIEMTGTEMVFNKIPMGMTVKTQIAAISTVSGLTVVESSPGGPAALFLKMKDAG